MLGLDTNVLVRFLVADDEAQFQRAKTLIEGEAARGDPALVSLLVLMETEWVLRSRYDLSPADITAAFALLLSTPGLRIEDEEVVEVALRLWSDTGIEFADALIAARGRKLGCTATVTFDAKAAKATDFALI